MNDPAHPARTTELLPGRPRAVARPRGLLVLGLALLVLSHDAQTMTNATTTMNTTSLAPTLSVPSTVSADDVSIRPFRVQIPGSEVQDMRRRILATRWPDAELVADSSQGVQLATMQALARYWATEYDWRRCEARLNAVPQFVTKIDGLDLHFVHVRSKHANALPIVVTHGWPGSIVEQMKLVGPLTDPVAHGGTAADAFDVVIPSLPGFGFSGKPTATGWDPARIARAWTVLMKRLGYERFTAQGGDWGALITEQMGVQAPPELLAIHTSLPSAVPGEILAALHAHRRPTGLAADESAAYERLDYFLAHGLAYAQQMRSRPQTLQAIADSPVGLAAWFLDHDLRSYELIARAFDGKVEGLTRDDVLDNVSLTWLTNTAISSARLYWENKIPFFVPMGVQVPVAVSAFPDEIYQAPRSWAERAYPKLVHFGKPAKGGHFAAWEEPELFADELRASFASFR